MATQLAVDFNGLNNALKLSLDTWGQHDSRYSSLYKTLRREVLEIAHAGLEEMKTIKPGSWEVWWAVNHNRFIRIKTIKQRELLLLHEIMYHFLSAFARGQLKNVSREETLDAPKKTKRSK